MTTVACECINLCCWSCPGETYVTWWIRLQLMATTTIFRELFGDGCRDSHGGRCFLSHLSVLFTWVCLDAGFCADVIMHDICTYGIKCFHAVFCVSNFFHTCSTQVGCDLAGPQPSQPTVCGEMAYVSSQ